MLAACLLACLTPAKSENTQHFTLYGFVRNYFVYDSRESVSGTGDLFNYQPKDHDWNQTETQAETSGIPRQDLNAVPTFRFLSLTTRLGIRVHGYQWAKTHFGATVEADFYAGLAKSPVHPVTGVAQLRLRHAYMTLAWEDPAGKWKVDMLMGQTWHPMVADLCDVLSLNDGAPFNPDNRSPQVLLNAHLGQYLSLSGAALWQMQYTSAGPDGPSAEYILYSKTPEAYLGLALHGRGLLFRAGADILSISPRHHATRNGVTVNVCERLTTVSPFIFFQYKRGAFSLKAKSVLAHSGEHLSLVGGYGVTSINTDGSWNYTPTRNSSSWLSLVYGGKVGSHSELQAIIFGGYSYNFGTLKEVIDADGDGQKNLYFSKNSFPNTRQLWRLAPALCWTVGHLQLGVEYELTAAQYDFHWVANHRALIMTRYNFSLPDTTK